MDARWIYFEFMKPVKNPKDIDSCGRCFVKFILENRTDPFCFVPCLRNGLQGRGVVLTVKK